MLIAILIVSLFLTACPSKDDPYKPQPVEPSDPIEQSGWISTHGKMLVDESGMQIVLKGVSIPDPEHLNTKPWERPNVTAKTQIDRAIYLGSNVIRIPVLDNTSDGHYLADPHSYVTNHLKPAVEYITSKNVYAIIDWHIVEDWEDRKILVLDFWNYVAPVFANNPFVIYELYNEPVAPEDCSSWSEFAQDGVTEIRKHAPKTHIIVGSPHWASMPNCFEDYPLNDRNVSFAWHIYAKDDRNEWEDFDTNNFPYPLFITEWGFEKESYEGGTLEGFGKPFVEWVNEENHSWVAWILDNRWIPRMFDENWNMTPFGYLVEDELRKSEHERKLMLP